MPIQKQALLRTTLVGKDVVDRQACQSAIAAFDPSEPGKRSRGLRSDQLRITTYSARAIFAAESLENGWLPEYVQSELGVRKY